MLYDSFRINSKIHPNKECSNTNAETFFTDFNTFYYDVRQNKNPNLPKKICDPYGFMLLCKDFKDEVNLDKNIKCKAVFEGKGQKNNITHGYYKGMFTFPQLLTLLYRGYLFDFDLAMNIYRIQHDPLAILTQIMKGRGFILNRYKPHLKKVSKLMNFASESKISLDENGYIPIPYLYRVCDGLSWPCIVHKNTEGYRISKEYLHGWGEGICILDLDDNIIDVLKINDTWLTETPLINRLKFADQFEEYEPIQYGKAWSLRSAYECAYRIGAEPHNGVLVRPCHQDYFSNHWFAWNENSLIYCCKIKGELTTYNVKRAQPQFYTLDGNPEDANPIECRKNEKMWLDDFDIDEFQRILDLND